MSFIQLLTFFLWCMYLSFIAFEGEDNKSKRALGHEGSSMQLQVKRTAIDDKRPTSTLNKSKRALGQHWMRAGFYFPIVSDDEFMS